VLGGWLSSSPRAYPLDTQEEGGKQPQLIPKPQPQLKSVDGAKLVLFVADRLFPIWVLLALLDTYKVMLGATSSSCTVEFLLS
jgi:hypothetical protein